MRPQAYSAMNDESMVRRGERRSIITLVGDDPGYLAPTALGSSNVEEPYPIEFNAAFWSGNGWTVHLGETLDLPEMRLMTPSRLVQCAHLFSDAVVFLAANLLSASTMYLEWLACCPLLVRSKSLKPAARIIIEGALYDVEAFMQQCAAQSKAGVLTFEQLKTSFFDNIEIEQVKHLTWTKYALPRMDIKYVAWEHICDSHRSLRRLRSNHGRLWTLSDFRHLASAWEATGNVPDDISLLTDWWPPGKYSLPEVLSSAESDITRGSGQDFEVLLKQRANLVGSYLMRHSFRSRHWTVPGECCLTNMFAEDQFRLRYLPIARSIARSVFEEQKRFTLAAKSKRYYPDNLVDMIQNCWLERTRSAYRTCDSILESAQLHIKQLRQHRQFLTTLQYGSRCAACLLEPWDHILPCKHGLCTLCLRACRGKETGGCRMDVHECPVCEQSVGFPCTRKFMPPTATLRVLALDGGGVKGLVQLHILEHLLDKIGLREGVHISSFFDLMVGSSIGNDPRPYSVVVKKLL
jgi:hypothetical protein